MSDVIAAYCDGGVIERNPSKIGGTWAYCHVTEAELMSNYGVITPDDVGLAVITNNLTELYAAVRCLESLPQGWDGVLHTDSLVTLNRLIHARSFTGVPRWLIDRTLKLRRNSKWNVNLVVGHATKEELRRGYRIRNKLPTSRINSLVDELCRRAAEEFLASVGDD